jgi:hypothetical protein
VSRWASRGCGSADPCGAEFSRDATMRPVPGVPLACIRTDFMPIPCVVFPHPDCPSRLARRQPASASRPKNPQKFRIPGRRATLPGIQPAAREIPSDAQKVLDREGRRDRRPIMATSDRLDWWTVVIVARSIRIEHRIAERIAPEVRSRQGAMPRALCAGGAADPRPGRYEGQVVFPPLKLRGRGYWRREQRPPQSRSWPPGLNRERSAPEKGCPEIDPCRLNAWALCAHLTGTS